jgi:hypothetical protein
MTENAGIVIALETATWGIITIVLSCAVVGWIFFKASRKPTGIHEGRRIRRDAPEPVRRGR